MYDEMKMHKRASAAAAAATSTSAKSQAIYVYIRIRKHIFVPKDICQLQTFISTTKWKGGETFSFFLFKRAQPPEEEEEETGQHSDASCEGLAGAAWHCL